MENAPCAVTVINRPSRVLLAIQPKSSHQGLLVNMDLMEAECLSDLLIQGIERRIAEAPLLPAAPEKRPWRKVMDFVANPWFLLFPAGNFLGLLTAYLGGWR